MVVEDTFFTVYVINRHSVLIFLQLIDYYTFSAQTVKILM